MMKKLPGLLVGLGLAAGAALGLATPARAAQTVSFWYGPFERSISVADLRQYITTGQVSPDLRGFLDMVKPKDRAGLQITLKTTFPLSTVKVSDLVYSPLGTKLLERVSPIFIRPDDAGVTALRAALVLATLQPGGLGLVSFLEAYPGSNVSINVAKLVKIARDGSLKDLMGTTPTP